MFGKPWPWFRSLVPMLRARLSLIPPPPLPCLVARSHRVLTQEWQWNNSFETELIDLNEKKKHNGSFVKNTPCSSKKMKLYKINIRKTGSQDSETLVVLPACRSSGTFTRAVLVPPGCSFTSRAAVLPVSQFQSLSLQRFLPKCHFNQASDLSSVSFT